MQQHSKEHVVFEGVHVATGAKLTGFIRKDVEGWDFELLSYRLTGELAFRIRPVQSAWARQIIDKFPDIDFGLIE